MRAAIFIDGGYVLNQFKQNKITPNYEALAEFFLKPIRNRIPLDLLRCYFYYCPPWMSTEPTEDELRRMDAHEAFVKEIEDLDRWQVRLGKLQKRRDGNKEYYEQKRVDVLLSVDLVRHAAAGHIQHAVLVAGDSDFIPAIAAAKESGVTLTLWCGASNTVHSDLMVLADEVHQFDWQKFPQVRPQQKDGDQQRSGRGDGRRQEARGGKDQSQRGSANGGRGGRRDGEAREEAVAEAIAPQGDGAPPQKKKSRRRRKKSSNQQNAGQGQGERGERAHDAPRSGERRLDRSRAPEDEPEPKKAAGIKDKIASGLKRMRRRTPAETN